MSKRKNVLDSTMDEVLEEAWSGGGSMFGGAPGGGSGSFQAGVTAGSASKTGGGGSPRHRSITGSSAPGEFNTQDISIENEMLAATAGNNKPYPLETIYESLVKAFIEMGNVEHQLHACIKYNSVLTDSPEKKVLIKRCEKEAAAIRIMIKKMGESIDTITVS